MINEESLTSIPILEDKLEDPSKRETLETITRWSVGTASLVLSGCVTTQTSESDWIPYRRKKLEFMLAELRYKRKGEVLQHYGEETAGRSLELPPDALSIGSDYRSWYEVCGTERKVLSGTIHRGIDLMLPGDYPVIAAESGTVTRSFKGKKWGNDIIVSHGSGLGFRLTRYVHLRARFVPAGDKVEKGQIIGAAGSWGSGYHVHFELQKPDRHLSDWERVSNPHPFWYRKKNLFEVNPDIQFVEEDKNGSPDLVMLFRPEYFEVFGKLNDGLIYPAPGARDIGEFYQRMPQNQLV